MDRGTSFLRVIGHGIIAIATIVTFSMSDSIWAQSEPLGVLQDNVLMRADSVTYDEDFGIITASGHVEISHGENILLADTISYNRRDDIVIATGNVALLSVEDDVVFSNYMELTGDLKSGTIRGIQILFSDGSRAAGVSGRMTGDGRREIRKAVYSPCELCPENHEKEPLWQIKSFRVIHDKSLKRIFYKDAFLEVFGVPVAYVPFFSHPDPSVVRKTGFLTPSMGRNSVFGLTYEQPFFFNIAPNRDATFAPIITSKDGVMLTGEYREVRKHGEYKLNGSITPADGERVDPQGTKETRGHLFGVGEFTVNPRWLAGFNVNRATDATYLGRYGIGRDGYLAGYSFGRVDSHLTSQAYLMGSKARNFSDLRILSFQSLDSSVDRDTVPYVAPFGRYLFRSEPSVRGDYWSVDADIRVIGRSVGAESRRVSVKGGWRLPFTSTAGEVYDLTLSLRSDLYHVADVADPANIGATQNGFTGRLLPATQVKWRYPFGRKFASGAQIVEPIVQFIWGPNGGNSSKIPNEDSVAFEFDDINLFSANRFPGLDRYEGGARLNYGMRTELRGETSGRSEVFFGQSYRAREDDTFEVGTGLDRHFSDFVGRTIIAPTDYLNLSHRFRLDRKNFAMRRSSVGAVVGPGWLQGSLAYTKLSDGSTIGVPTSLEQVNLGLNYEPRKHWRLNVSHQRDLTEGGGGLFSSVGLVYQDECVLITTSLNRYFNASNSGVPPLTDFFIRVTLRNLG